MRDRSFKSLPEKKRGEAMAWKSGDECELGTLLIDWERRRLEMEGIDGCSPGMRPQDVLAFLQKKDDEQIDRFAMVYWHEPKQFCLYGMDDFVNEVWDETSDDDNCTLGQLSEIPQGDQR
jgi:hypothetical protein